MDAAIARQRIQELAAFRCFISVSNETGPGPVVAVKDMIDVAGMTTTGGGRLVPYRTSEADATVVHRLRAQGGIVIGKTNLHEWGLGVTGINPHFGPVRNPRAPERITGGSSSGSAAAVALGMCDWAIGTDSGGSIRIPAALCGVVGIKPTTGLVDMTGVLPLSPTLDTVGPIAPDVAAAARALEVMAGRTGLVPQAGQSAADLRIAVAATWAVSLDGPTGKVWSAVSRGLPAVDLPALQQYGSVLRDVLFHEAYDVHRAALDDRPGDFGDDVRTSLIAGRNLPTATYQRALAARKRLAGEMDAALAQWDAVLLPTCPVVAPRLDAPSSAGDLVLFTNPFNLCGNPVVALPAPSIGPVPVGLQVVGRRGEDATAIQVAAALERLWSAPNAGSGPAPR